MHERFEEKNKEVKRNNLIINIYNNAEEIYKMASILNGYCKAYKNFEHVYRILSMTQLLEKQTDNLYHDLCKLHEIDNPTPLPEFLTYIAENIENYHFDTDTDIQGIIKDNN